MRIGRTITTAIAAGMLAAAAGHPVHAGDSGGGCGSDPAKPATKWITRAKCHFQFRGFPLLVRGSATATSGATIHVWISAIENGPALLVECSATGGGSASCQAGYPDSSTMIDIEQLQTIWCNVEGRSSGQYWCQSASGI